MTDTTTDTAMTEAEAGATPVRSRRALLGAAVGAGAAAAAGALARPLPVAATVTAMSTGQVNTADALTGLVFDTTGTAFYVSTAVPVGPQGTGLLKVVDTTGAAIGITESNTAGWGINLEATGSDGIGIGISATGANAKGIQVDGGAVGVQASAQTDGGIGVDGSAFNAGSIGVSGYGATGVDGQGQTGLAGSIGVRGRSTAGVGGQFESSSGTALKVTGKVSLNRSGTATVLAGKTSVDVTVPGGITSSSMGFAVLRTYRSGVHVAAVYRVSSTGKLRIRLNKVASSTSNTTVSWLVLG